MSRKTSLCSFRTELGQILLIQPKVAPPAVAPRQGDVIRVSSVVTFTPWEEVAAIAGRRSEAQIDTLAQMRRGYMHKEVLPAKPINRKQVR